MCIYPFDPKLHRTIVLPTLSYWDNLEPPQTPPCEHCFLSKFVVSNFQVMVWSHQGYFGPTFCTVVIRDERTTPWTCLATIKPPLVESPLGGHALRLHQACSGRAPLMPDASTSSSSSPLSSSCCLAAPQGFPTCVPSLEPPRRHPEHRQLTRHRRLPHGAARSSISPWL